jgi:methylamine dehydrogenase heavy chain
MLCANRGKRLFILSLILLLAACGKQAPGTGAGANKGSAAVTPNPDLPPLPVEETGHTASLPRDYPQSWFLVHDVAFHHMLDGNVTIIDAAADSVPKQFKGLINVSLVGNVGFSKKRHEIYAVETFYSRGNRGQRTDVLTIYDTRSLSPVGEVIWPKPKRFMGMPERYAVALLDNDRLLLAFNFTPATSVTVINLDTRKIVNDVEIPGCSLVYPTGQTGFTSICADGGLLSTELDADGHTVKQTRLPPFFNSDTEPVFERPAIINNTAYFFGFAGPVHSVDLSGPVASVGDSWQLVPEADRAKNWRPGGIAIVDTDSQGRFYILMHPDGHEGTQNSGGSEVWVYDAAGRQRISRIKLKNWGLSVAVGGGDKPLLLVTDADMKLDIYDADSGNFVRTIDGVGLETPLIAYGMK